MRESAEHRRFATWDGTELFYRHWPAEGASQKAVILFHRGHEHSARWQDVVEKLKLTDCHIFAWDARGHGNSSGMRGYADNFQSLVRDADAFVTHVSLAYGIAVENMAVMAHSVDVAACKHNRLGLQTSGISGPHYLRISVIAEPHYLQMGPD